jgi:ABC-type transporter Mla MlaB component
MLRIQERSDGENSVTFSLSGRIESQHIDDLRRMIETEHRKVSLDLEEVKLVDSDAVRFLSSCIARGIELRNCPPYVHQWILGMLSSKCGP